MTDQYDFLVIGAGISGAAAGYELAKHGALLLLEMEERPGYHSTGRSAALYTPNYGPLPVRQISQAAYPFLRQPPAGFTDHPLLTPRGALTVATRGDEAKLDGLLANSLSAHPIEEISLGRTMELCPLLRPETPSRAIYEPGVMDMDVAAMHQGFLRGLKSHGGVVAPSQEAIGIERVGGIERVDSMWQVQARAGTFRAPIVVNAAGAWADLVGQLAGCRPIGLTPKRRTGMIVDAPAAFYRADMPMVNDVGTEAYFKPDGGRIMASPADATPVAPQDAQPDDMVIAELADWLQRYTRVEIRRISHSWAGLRSFVADESPVVGFDPDRPGFFWLAGQGGFGIMMSGPLGRAVSELIRHDRLPADLVDRGLRPADLSPIRLNRQD